MDRRVARWEPRPRRSGESGEAWQSKGLVPFEKVARQDDGAIASSSPSSNYIGGGALGTTLKNFHERIEYRALELVARLETFWTSPQAQHSAYHGSCVRQPCWH